MRDCPVCGQQRCVPLLPEGASPLSTQGWPRSASEARTLPVLPHRYVRCVACGHVWNQVFDPTAITGPTHMFNAGESWRVFITQQVARIARQMPAAPRILEVGHGDGAFLMRLARECPGAALLGVDPAPTLCADVPTRQRRFEPLRDVAEWRPDVVVMRHVLEHLTQPHAVLESVVHAATLHDHPLMMYLEVPCFDVGLARGRASDLIYEHCSHFTTRSFGVLLQRAGMRICEQGVGYAGEVVWALTRVEPSAVRRAHAVEAAAFHHAVIERDARLREVLKELAMRQTVIWGGTGKAALFIHRHGLDAERFPRVVDSDARKVGTFVPGTGQRILSPAHLRDSPPEFIIIATAWRAADIVVEVRSLGLTQTPCLVLHAGRLAEWGTFDADV